MLSARILDIPGAHAQTNVELTNALLSDPPPAGLRRGTAWDRLVDACSSDNRRKVRDAMLNRIGARQGGGPTSHAIELGALSPALTAFKRTWKLSEPPDVAPTEFKRLYADIQGRINPAIAEELVRLQTWHERTSAAIDPAALPSEISDAISEAAEAALNAGIFEPQRLRTEFTETTRIFRRTRYSVVKDVGELVATAESQPLGKLLSDLAADRSRPVAEIDRFITSAELVVAASIDRGRQQAEVLRAGGDADGDLRTLFNLLGMLRATLEGGRP
jgi:hypothetical protein